jgi:hypothetical protein
LEDPIVLCPTVTERSDDWKDQEDGYSQQLRRVVLIVGSERF